MTHPPNQPMPAATVLCVDDERIVLRSLKEQLSRSLGSSVLVETADSGEEALEVVEELQAAGRLLPLLISDQQMPGMKGDELLSAVHAIAPDTLKILLTGQASADAIGAAVNRASLYRFIAKPWRESDLVLTVREALRTHENAREIAQKSRALAAAHQASLRFVPQRLLSLLGREQVADIRHGDHMEREITIFSSDMRSFTSLVEGLSARDAFTFINEYMRLMDEVINASGGFVSKIEGDAVTALFPGHPADAVKAGVLAHRALSRYNRERKGRGELPVAMGIGVDTGPVLLGTVGDPQRLQCDVVGDCLRLSSRIESLTKRYQVAMLLSGATREKLDEDTAAGLRFIDRLRVNGEPQPVALYEVLDALPPELAAARRAGEPIFREASELYRGGKLAEAALRFEELAHGELADGAARVLADRCRTLLERGLPGDWDGVTELETG